MTSPQLHSPKSCLEHWRRILIVAAHPDDEVLALGGHFRSLHPRILHLTDGGFSTIAGTKVAKLRSRELERALRLGGIPKHHRFSCGVADQCTIDFLPAIFVKLREVVQLVKPNCLLTHAYEGGHPDHDAASLVSYLVALSVANLPILEYPSYHNGTPFAPTATWATSVFLQPGGMETSIRLSGKQQTLKKRMLAAHRSQSEVLRRFPVSVERFRPAPDYNYLEPPHPGTLLYEAFGWDTYPSWKKRASEAIERIAMNSTELIGGSERFEVASRI